MRKRLLFLCFVVSAACTQAQTTYYQCKDERGQPVFSQRPCGQNAAQKSITPQATNDSSEQTEASPDESDNRSQTDSATSVVESESSWEKVTASRRVREIEREVERREDKIDRLERERDAKIARLDNSQRYANNNLAGAQYMESLATEMRAVNDQYEAKIDSEQRKIDRLLDESEKHQEILR